MKLLVKSLSKLVFGLLITTFISSSFFLPLGIATAKQLDFSQQVAESIKKVSVAYQGAVESRKLFAIRANSAFIFPPSVGCKKTAAGKAQLGILLVHDLYQSPYVMQALGRELSNQCFLVYGLRLAGHGTRIGYLEKISFNDWQAQIKAAFVELKAKSEKVVFFGAGLGANLGYIHRMTEENSFDGLVLQSFSLKNCGKNQGYRAASSWGSYEEKIAAQHKYQDDIVTYYSQSAVAEKEARLGISQTCKLARSRTKLKVPTLIVFGDRSFNLRRHGLDNLTYQRELVQILYFTNSRLNQSLNIAQSKYKLIIYDLSAAEGALSLTGDEYLTIPYYDPWYGIKPGFLRCKLAIGNNSTRDFCIEGLRKLPKIKVMRDKLTIDVYYRSYNYAFEQLTTEVTSFLNQFLAVPEKK